MKNKILVIEDESDIRNDILKALEFSGYDTDEATDGDEGVRKAMEILPDLIISDIMMPKLSGHEVLQKLQDNPATASIPFLFLSAKSDKIHIREGMVLGADDYITKPYDLDELLNAISARIAKSTKIETKFNDKINKLRTSFSKSIPHEIRTPLNIILGLSDYLSKKTEEVELEDLKEMLININDAGKRLQRLFDNYLFYSNLEVIASNQEEYENIRNQKLDYVDILVNDSINYKADQYRRLSDININVTNSHIKMGEKYFLKIVDELIDNALKFSELGSSIDITSFSSGNNYILEFHDRGRGMSAEEISQIDAYVQFERNFYEQQGNGLGLSIVKKILTLHSGDFKIISEKNSFTKVIISIPKV